MWLYRGGHAFCFRQLAIVRPSRCAYYSLCLMLPVSHRSVLPQASCYLQDCLSDYTRLEILEDCICQKCSMVATWKRLEDEAEKLSQDASGHDASSSKKKRAREARKLASRVKAALTEGRIEDEIRGVKLEKVFSRESTKQAMIARVCSYSNPSQLYKLICRGSHHLFWHFILIVRVGVTTLRRTTAIYSSLNSLTSHLIRPPAGYLQYRTSPFQIKDLTFLGLVHRLQQPSLQEFCIVLPLLSVTLVNTHSVTISVIEGSLDRSLLVLNDLLLRNLLVH